MANQTWHDVLQRKRSREHDEYADIAAGGSLGFTEHRSKRTQVLPLRASPPSKYYPDDTECGPVFRSSFEPYPSEPVFQISTVTPGACDSEEAAAAAAAAAVSAGQQGWAFESAASLPTYTSYPGAEQDTDMMDTEDLDSSGLAPTGVPQSRMPTPINCNFAAQVRGTNWGGGAIASATGPMTTPTECHYTQQQASSGIGANDTAFQTNASRIDAGCWAGASASRESIPRSLGGPGAAAQVMADWTMVQNRRLPSPISESGGEDGGMGSPETPLSSMDGSGSHPYHPNTQPRGHMPARASSSAVELGRGTTRSEDEEEEDEEGEADAWAGQVTMLAAGSGSSPQSATSHDSMSTTATDMGYAELSSPATGPSSSPSSSLMPTTVASSSPIKRFGHTRSKHTLNSWTAFQPGMKRSFSIGYRPDCDKCRDKVPGHFNHIIIS